MRLDHQVLDYLRGYFVARDRSSTLDGSLLPQEDATYNLGSSYKRFDEIWANRYMGNVNAFTLEGKHADDIARFFDTDATDIANETAAIGAVGVDESTGAVYIGGLIDWLKFDSLTPTYKTLTISPTTDETALIINLTTHDPTTPVIKVVGPTYEAFRIHTHAYTGKMNLMIGYSVGNATMTGQMNFVFGGYQNDFTDASWNTLLGIQAGQNITGGDRNFLGGFQAGAAITTGGDNVGLGNRALSGNNPNYTIGIGTEALYLGTGGLTTLYGVAIGYQAGQGYALGYNYITLVGGYAGQTASGHYLVAYGFQAGKSSTGGSSVFLGTNAGLSASGGGNVAVGHNAGQSWMTGNQLAIANSSTTSPLIYGNFSTSYLKINGKLETTNDITISNTGGLYLGASALNPGSYEIWSSGTIRTAAGINIGGTDFTETASTGTIKFIGTNLGVIYKSVDTSSVSIWGGSQNDLTSGAGIQAYGISYADSNYAGSLDLFGGYYVSPTGRQGWLKFWSNGSIALFMDADQHVVVQGDYGTTYTTTSRESLQVNDHPTADWYNLVRFGTDRPIGFFTKTVYKNITFNAEYDDATSLWLGGNDSTASDYSGLFGFYTDTSTFILAGTKDPHVEGASIAANNWVSIIYASANDDAAGGVSPGITLWGNATDSRSPIKLANQDGVFFPVRIGEDYPTYYYSNGTTSRALVFNGVFDTQPNWLAGEGSTDAGAGMLVFVPESSPRIGLLVNLDKNSDGAALDTNWNQIIAGDYLGRVQVGMPWGTTWADAIKFNVDDYPLMLTNSGATDNRLSSSLGSSHISLQINQGVGSILRAGNDTPVYLNSYSNGGGISANAYLGDTLNWYFGEQSVSGSDYAGIFQFDTSSAFWAAYVSTATGNEDSAITWNNPFKVYSNRLYVDSAIDIKEAASIGTPASGFGRLWVNTDGVPQWTDDAGNERDVALSGWDDLRVPVSSIQRLGYSDPGWAKLKDNGSGSVGVYIPWFDATTVEEVYFVVQLPHSWQEGTNIKPHVHWTPKTTGASGQFVRWGLEYTWANIDGSYGNTTIIYTDATSAAAATTSGDSTMTADKHYMTLFSEIDATGKTLSSMLVCRLFRDASNGDDDYPYDAGLLEVDFHYYAYRLGNATF